MIIFSEYTRLVDHSENVLLYGLPEDQRAVKSWLHYLMQAGRLDDAQRTWNWVSPRGYADDSTAGEYAGFLVQQGHPDSAVSAWAQHLGPRARDYRKSTYLFNGSFEFEPNPSPFDWNLGHAQGVEVTRDCTTAWSGELLASHQLRGYPESRLRGCFAAGFCAVRPSSFSRVDPN